MRGPADVDAVTVAEAQGEARESSQLRDEGAASAIYMKRGPTALPLATPPQPAVNSSWGLFLTEQIPTIRYCFLKKGGTSCGV